MTTHIMIDLETWGKKPGNDLRSVGACLFDPITGELPQSPDGEGMDDATMFYVATDNPIWHEAVFSLDERAMEYHTHYDATSDAWRKYPLTRDPETVEWWNSPDRAIAAGEPFLNPVDLRNALHTFADWLHHVSGRIDPYSPGVNYVPVQCIALWSHGPAFDVAILAAAYEAVGLPVPWHYRAPRDTRTAFDMADVGDHSAWMQQFNHGTAHHALDDAISQAKAVCGAYAIVQNWRGGYRENEAFIEWKKAQEPDATFNMEGAITTKVINEMMAEGRITCRCGSSGHIDADCPFRGSSPL